jgi:hypothetical protein
MLPGFRFLFAAIVLSMSILVFGLGAAALLRAAHEEVSSNPAWRAAPETVFAQQGETTPPVLAMLHVEPPPAEPKAPDDSPAIAAPVQSATIASAPAEPAASASTPAEPERIAALKPDDAPPPETAKPAMPLAETPAPTDAPPARADASAAADEARIASSEKTSSDKVVSDKALPDKASPPANDAAPAVNEAAPAASEQISAPALPDADAGATKIATLGSPAIITEATTPAKAAGAKPDRSVIKKRQQARRAAQRRRLAARARLAQQPAQPAADPFAQPAITVRKR